MFTQSAWAQGAEAAAGSNIPALVFSYAPLLLIVAVFYFLVIRPQGVQARQHAAMLKALAKGDVVETQGGVIAVVAKVDDRFVTLTSGGSTTVVTRAAVSRKLGEAEAKLAGVKK